MVYLCKVISFPFQEYTSSKWLALILLTLEQEDSLMSQILINNAGNQKAGMISILRRYTGIGLKAAKDTFDSIEHGNFLVITDVPETDVATVIADFSAYGVSASKISSTAYSMTSIQLRYSKESITRAQYSDSIRLSAEQSLLNSSPRSGIQQPSVVPLTHMASNNVSSSELDRNALKIYLYDVLTLECINNKYQTRLRNLASQVASAENISYIKNYQSSVNREPIYFKYDGSKYYIALYSDDYGKVNKVYTDGWLRNNCFLWLEVETNLAYLQSHQAWYCIVGNLFDRIKYKNNAIKHFNEAYINFKATAPDAYQTLLCNNSMMIKERMGLNKELQEVQRLLVKAYSCNIIPGAFRNNLYAIYYLYDFINTSNESFSTALLHYDLNEIKSKLDKIISQQQEIIIQQSMLMAQNSQLFDQNQAFLKKLSNIEASSSQTAYNTAQSAYYSEIAANNSEICAWIGLANYLKD